MFIIFVAQIFYVNKKHLNKNERIRIKGKAKT